MKQGLSLKSFKESHERSGIHWKLLVEETITELTYKHKLRRPISFSKVSNLFARNNKVKLAKEDILNLSLDDIERFKE